MSGSGPAEQPLPSRRALRQHRRVDSAAGTPAGESGAAILDLPAASVSPADVGLLTGQLPRAYRWPFAPGEVPASGAPARAVPAEDAPGDTAAFTVDRDGVPVGPDGRPLTRRQLRALRERWDGGGAEDVVHGADGASSSGAPARRADAPAGAPLGALAEGTDPEATGQAGGAANAAATPADDVDRALAAAFAREADSLTERVEATGGEDPTAVDPELLREQLRLADTARRLNETGAMAIVPPATDPVMVVPVRTGPAQDAPVPAGAAATVPEPLRHEPLGARSAHGLDSLSAREWTARERTPMIVAGVAFAVLLIALALALVS
ncbi:hypothetical protein E7744_08815 [Citricoccus sp. SGAir0253]|uniref:hypothetical protein n=1 Tax=Citricoccus sp. SGAir0253 TaxID=2567881 RepID=UPI0010CD66A7|nr:hypothetical protein [Citricoccus sp. SGAir0253]QCU78261.1 hypothetical protein E7744_08815 [Citricoccus sp. SGAir0253]